MHYTLAVLKAAGFDIRKTSKIVDFGCGAGSFIRQARAEGYDAVGCDFNRGDGPETQALIEQGIIRMIEQNPYRLPYDDNSVDFIISETVLEHVMNPEEAAREMARILKPGGAAFHYFPAKFAPIESHIFVPFANFIQAKPYLAFWAQLGVRNSFQKKKNLTARETVENNIEFLNNSTHYLTERQIRAIYGRHFGRVNFVEDIYLQQSESKKARQLAKFNNVIPLAGYMYRTFWANPLLLVKKAA